ncbi:MAG: energy-coupling factor transporter transmembrane protein EcfT [Azoarcus sp.]|jgi:energy-coupling factor transporter transmembrane protein EcfT|nr:energy-coupling factor transporter transmembrane protein EcfT [Azoarcus sp.]
MHAGSILFLWMAAALCVQAAEGWLLAGWVAMSLAAAWGLAHARCARLLVRVRALLLAIVVLFAWFTPGEAVFVDWPRLGPSREGCLLALVQGGRLLAIVCGTAVLLARMPSGRLVSGLYALARPCACFGLPAEKVALRLLLVLRYVEEARLDGHGGGDRGWRYWLSPPPAGGFETVQLVQERPGLADAGLLVALVVLSGMWWLW